MKYTIRLNDDTNGTHIASEAPEIGDTVTLSTQTENGLPDYKTGVVAEILESFEEWH